jgi:hypothetical protein
MVEALGDQSQLDFWKAWCHDLNDGIFTKPMMNPYSQGNSIKRCGFLEVISTLMKGF